MKKIILVLVLLGSFSAFAEILNSCEGYMFGQKASLKISINDVESEGLFADFRIPSIDYRFVGSTGPGTYDSQAGYGEVHFYKSEERLVVSMDIRGKSAVLFLNGEMSSTFSCR
jgi:hypothetical protein